MQKLNLSRRHFLAGAGLAAGSAVLAGCGGTSAPAASGSAAGSAAASDDPNKITFALDWTPNTNHTGIYVAQAKGFFKDEGLDVEIVQPAEDGTEAMVGTGQVQFGVSFQDYIANSLVSGNTGITAVAAIVQHNTSGIMSRKEDGITSPAKMEGHSYGTWDLPVEQGVVKQAVESDGGDFSKVELVPNEARLGLRGLGGPERQDPGLRLQLLQLHFRRRRARLLHPGYRGQRRLDVRQPRPGQGFPARRQEGL